MNNNDVLRRLRYTFNFNDKTMVNIFESAGESVNREQISQWLKKDNDEAFVTINDQQLAVFLNGFINEKRGKKPGAQPTAEKRLTNNIILTKIKIALNLQAEQIIALLDTVDFRLSKPELSAFSRKVDHKHYRECKDQVLRNLLQAIDKKYHVERTAKIVKPVKDNKASSAGYSKSSAKNSTKSTAKKEAYVEGARPNASKIYVNPKSTKAPSKTKLQLPKKK